MLDLAMAIALAIDRRGTGTLLALEPRCLPIATSAPLPPMPRPPARAPRRRPLGAAHGGPRRAGSAPAAA